MSATPTSYGMYQIAEAVRNYNSSSDTTGRYVLQDKCIVVGDYKIIALYDTKLEKCYVKLYSRLSGILLDTYDFTSIIDSTVSGAYEYFDIWKIDDTDRFCLGYMRTSDFYAYIKGIQIVNNLLVTSATAVPVQSATSLSIMGNYAGTSTSSILVSDSSNNLKTYACTWSGTVPTVGGVQTVYGGIVNAYRQGVEWCGTGTDVVAFYVRSNRIYCKKITITGTTSSVGTESAALGSAFNVAQVKLHHNIMFNTTTYMYLVSAYVNTNYYTEIIIIKHDIAIPTNPGNVAVANIATINTTPLICKVRSGLFVVLNQYTSNYTNYATYTYTTSAVPTIATAWATLIGNTLHGYTCLTYLHENNVSFIQQANGDATPACLTVLVCKSNYVTSLLLYSWYRRIAIGEASYYHVISLITTCSTDKVDCSIKVMKDSTGIDLSKCVEAGTITTSVDTDPRKLPNSPICLLTSSNWLVACIDQTTIAKHAYYNLGYIASAACFGVKRSI